jgi:hypothetical protein
MANITGPVKQYTVSIGGIGLKFVADDSLLLNVNETYQKFMTKNEKVDINIKVHFGELPEIVLDKKVFDTRGTGGPWTLYSSGDKYIYATYLSPTDPIPHRIAVFDEDFTSGDLYINSSHQNIGEDNPINYGENGAVSCDPIDYPFDEFVYIKLLSQGRGVNLHACGISLNNKGVLFSGVSGAGKSTIANLWKIKKADILSDDRVIVRRIDGEFFMFGTPWHGDALVSLAQKAPLKAIFFLVKGKENKIIPLSIKDSAFRLTVRCIPTFYSKQGMEYLLEIITAIAQNIPCYELQFTPDERAVDLVIAHVKNLT